MSPSRMPASIIESPLTRRRKSASRPSGSGTAISLLDRLLGEERPAGGDAGRGAAASEPTSVARRSDVLDACGRRARWLAASSGRASADRRARGSRGARARSKGRRARPRRRSPERSADSRARPRTRRGTARSPVVVSSASGSPVSSGRTYVRHRRVDPFPDDVKSSRDGPTNAACSSSYGFSTVVSTSSSPASAISRVQVASREDSERVPVVDDAQLVAGTASDDQVVDVVRVDARSPACVHSR